MLGAAAPARYDRDEVTRRKLAFTWASVQTMAASTPSIAAPPLSGLAPSPPPPPPPPHPEGQEQRESQEEEEEPMSHIEVMAIVRNELSELLDDPLIADFPSDVRVEEVNLQIALEHGQAMTVIVTRADGEVMPVVVMQSATVQDLKSAIKRFFELKQDRDHIKEKISWRYVWRSYHLAFSGESLQDDTKKIRDYGIRNRDEVTFIKKLGTKGAGH